MGSSKITKLTGIATVLILLISAWTYSQKFDQRLDEEVQTVSLEMGIALFHEKKYPEALDIFEQINTGDPQKWRALYYQGSTQIMLKDYQSAVVYLDQALALNPTNTQIMNSLGVAYFKLGNLKMSKAYFASILEIDPNNMEAKGLMDIMANLERQQPGAEQVYDEESLDEDPRAEDPESLDKSGH